MQTECVVVAAMAVCVAAGLARSQQSLDLPRGEFAEVEVESGPLDNPGDNWASIELGEVAVDGAAWVRLHFDGLTLVGGSRLRVTSLLDGEVQTHDAVSAAEWNLTTAYFNGDRVTVEALLAPRTAGTRVTLRRVSAEREAPAWPSALCGICVPDTRAPTNLGAYGRLMPVGCSGVVSCTKSVVLSAGHCVSGDLVVQFNVPASGADCKPRHPPVEDQFPVTWAQFEKEGVGNDWAVLNTGLNSEGQTIFEKYKAMIPVSEAVASLGQAVDVVGYGAVEAPDCEKTQTQQHSGGVVTLVKNAHYKYDNDVTYGNSGSPLMANGEIVGIVTHCSTVCGNNIATRTDRPNFVAAREAASDCARTWCVADFNHDGVVNSMDVLAFLSAYALGDMSADVDGDGLLTTLDVLVFLNAFTGGCP
ncbi:MAG TPA: GC-type dockerin domain-anchored protein [Phycisphaerales bacterium]|nr:GC-type dockerin domain-anchored protein [Phycisphaerales bacterium]